MTTHPSGLVTEAFEAQRDRLRALAYRVLGSHAEAKDVVQEAWMRLGGRGRRRSAGPGPASPSPVLCWTVAGRLGDADQQGLRPAG